MTTARNAPNRVARRRPDAITMTTQDHTRLTQLVERYAEGRFADLAEALDDELARARIVPQSAIPPDIVTMNSTCVFRFADTDERREVTIVYPEQADFDTQRVSVLAPIGAALLGLGAGQSIRWPTPEGERELEVVAVTYQPEAAGHLHL
jgi:regulator of nucleoside diphosphate kinase